jgi:hypothetical protein
MCEANGCKGEGDVPLFDRNDLAASLELILSGDVRAADEMARLLDSFRHALDGGLRGSNEARAALVAAVELTYLRTGAHASALRLYRLSLEGHLMPGDEPDTLYNSAIERSARSVRAARTSGRARGRI